MHPRLLLDTVTCAECVLTAKPRLVVAAAHCKAHLPQRRTSHIRTCATPLNTPKDALVPVIICHCCQTLSRNQVGVCKHEFVMFRAALWLLFSAPQQQCGCRYILSPTNTREHINT